MVMEITNSGLDFAKKSNFRTLSQYNLYTIRIRLEKQKKQKKNAFICTTVMQAIA